MRRPTSVKQSNLQTIVKPEPGSQYGGPNALWPASRRLFVCILRADFALAVAVALAPRFPTRTL